MKSAHKLTHDGEIQLDVLGGRVAVVHPAAINAFILGGDRENRYWQQTFIVVER